MYNQTALIISKNITSIITYYKKDHNLNHKNIILHSRIPIEEFHEILNSIQMELAEIKVKYIQLKKGDKPLCQKANSDLSILIPNSILAHSENIFGTLTIDLELEDNILVVKNEQIFTTSTGIK